MSARTPSVARARRTCPSLLHRKECTLHQLGVCSAIDFRPRHNCTTHTKDGGILALAGARVHEGILFSSVSNPNRSSADAMNCASTVSVVVLLAFPDPFVAPTPSAFFFGAASLPGLAGVTEPDGAGVLWREVCPDTVRSLPCVSIIAAGNVESFASSTAGRRDLASWNSVSTAAERAVVRLHSYYDKACASE